MAYLGVLAALVIGGIVLFVWFKLYRDIVQSNSLDSLSSRKSRGGGPNSLEEFIAAYRSGAVAADGAVATTRASAATPDAPAVTVPVRRDPFLGPAVKLGYYLCKTGLKDHHVFVYVQLAALAANSTSDAALAPASVDLVVCNPAMSVVAALGLIRPHGYTPQPTKVGHPRPL